MFRSDSTLVRLAITVALAGVWACATDGQDIPTDGGNTPSADADSDPGVTSGTVTFQDGVSPTAAYAGTRDTVIQEASPSASGGTATVLNVDRDVPSDSGQSALSLIRWDTSSIPEDSQVTAASLTFHVNNPTSGAGYNVYKVLRNWTEAEATWSQAATGADWQTAGARGDADREAPILATLTPDAVGLITIPLGGVGLAAVQDWVNDPTHNFGIVLDAVNNKDGLGLDSRESATPAHHPMLSLTFQKDDMPPPGTVTDLDVTGKTIPDSNYAIPVGAIYMATTGNDASAGTLAAPVKTLNRAVTLTPPGGTIVVRGGIYHDGYKNGATYGIANRSITFQAYPHEKAWFDGTDVVATAEWTSDGDGHWSTPWNTPSFCENGYYTHRPDDQPTTNHGPCSHWDMYADPANPMAGDPQMVFIDGVYVHQVKTKAEASAGNFFYDWTAKRLYIGTNPSGHTVELAARAVFLVMGGTATVNVKILGLGFRRFATNEYSNQTGAAVTLYGKNITIENSVFTEMAGQGLSVGAKDSVVRHNVLVRNGFNGLGSNGSSNSGGGADGLLIEDNVIAENNTERFGTNCSASCAQAGIKLGHMVGFTMRNNVVQNNDGWGLWCDLDCSGGIFVNNLIRNNTRGGLLYEVSDTGIIASNVVYGNGGTGIRVCSANTKIFNNTVVGNATSGSNSDADIWIYDDPRSKGVAGWNDVGPDTVNVQVVNNVISGPFSMALRISGQAAPPNTKPEAFFTAFDFNAYHREDAQRFALWQDGANTNYATMAAFSEARGFDTNGLDVSEGADPFFVDPASNDYRIRAGSAASKSGTTVPSDVAAALGITTTTGLDRGAITWPGK